MTPETTSLDCVAVRPLSAKRIIETSSVRVTSKGLLGSDHVTPVAGGLMDLRFGSQRDMVCTTCHQLSECIGHSGHYVLYRPVLPYYFRQTIVQVLRCMCPSCHRFVLLLHPDDQKPQLKRALCLPARRRFEEVTRLANATKQCPHEDCAMPLPDYKRDTNCIVRSWPAGAAFPSPEDKAALTATLTEQEILMILRAVPIEISEHIFGMAPGSRVEDLVMTVLPIPSTKIRPSVGSASKTRARRDDFTELYHKIIEDDQRLRSMDAARASSATEPDLTGGVGPVLVDHSAPLPQSADRTLRDMTASIDELLARFNKVQIKPTESDEKVEDDDRDYCTVCDDVLDSTKRCPSCDINDCFLCDEKDCMTLPCAYCKRRVGLSCGCAAGQFEATLSVACVNCFKGDVMLHVFSKQRCASCFGPMVPPDVSVSGEFTVKWRDALRKRTKSLVVDKPSCMLCPRCLGL